MLDQENSKKFLQGSDHDKYTFFMRVADLDRILRVSDSMIQYAETVELLWYVE